MRQASMNEPEICPKCSTCFDARKALLSGGFPLGFSLFTYPDVLMKVRCPGCWHIFPARTFRFFGLLSPNAFRRVFVFAMVTGIALALWISPAGRR
ncbi:hypothetical protein [Niveibacterium sp. SC-1]|uniref:hypothetical protein n=1 Tax=Niveibacterium sp. SC-1 TaxID=3135646 RepID=UPI00311E1A67